MDKKQGWAIDWMQFYYFGLWFMGIVCMSSLLITGNALWAVSLSVDLFCFSILWMVRRKAIENEFRCLSCYPDYPRWLTAMFGFFETLGLLNMLGLAFSGAMLATVNIILGNPDSVFTPERYSALMNFQDWFFKATLVSSAYQFLCVILFWLPLCRVEPETQLPK